MDRKHLVRIGNKGIYAGDSHKRTKPFRVLSLILFFTPDVYLREPKVWTDELVIEEVWKNFHGKADLRMGGFRSMCEHVNNTGRRDMSVSFPGLGRGRGEDFG
jgi:hypothetical protein